MCDSVIQIQFLYAIHRTALFAVYSTRSSWFLGLGSFWFLAALWLCGGLFSPGHFEISVILWDIIAYTKDQVTLRDLEGLR